MGAKGAKNTKYPGSTSIYFLYSLGVATNRDEWAYDFSADNLSQKMKRHIENYNYEVFRLSQEKIKPDNIDDFVNNDSSLLKWTDRLKESLRQGRSLSYSETVIRTSIYRPFVKMSLYFDHLLNQRRYQQPRIFPNGTAEKENKLICVSGLGAMKPFQSLMVSNIPCLDTLEKTQCFPYYVYDTDGTNRRENITSWALEQFRAHYKNAQIKKWDIFYYIYGILHHPAYRDKYGDCLKRELPRIPFAPDFEAFAAAGNKLAKLHLNYEQMKPYELKIIEAEDIPFSYRVVDKMRLDKNKTSITLNPSLTLAGIPKAAFDYQLGNRSALEWVIDQYQVSKNERSGNCSDPNNPDDEQYIVRLLGQVIAVSLETVKIVKSLPKSFGG